jgi:hypothetical protein
MGDFDLVYVSVQSPNDVCPDRERRVIHPINRMLSTLPSVVGAWEFNRAF